MVTDDGVEVVDLRSGVDLLRELLAAARKARVEQAKTLHTYAEDGVVIAVDVQGHYRNAPRWIAVTRSGDEMALGIRRGAGAEQEIVKISLADAHDFAMFILDQCDGVDR